MAFYPPEWRAILICVFVCVGALQFGYDSSYFSGILVMEPFLKIFGHYDAETDAYVLSSSRQSLVTSIINVGEFLGAISAFYVGDKTGRRGGLFLTSAIVMVGTTLQIASTSLGLLIAGRLVLGYAVGLISCFVPLYAADCAPARFRGAVVSMYQWLLGIGLLLGVCVDYGTSTRTDTGSFRIPIGVQYLFPIVLIPGLYLFCPESPRWLAQKGRMEEAENALRMLNGPGVDVSEQLNDIVEAMRAEAALGEGSWKSVFTWGPEGRKAYLGCALQALQQSSGINFITGYGVYFFTTVGIDNAFLISVGLYICGYPAMIFSQYGIEKWGRRPLLIVSGVFMVIALMVMGGIGLQDTLSYSEEQTVVGMVFLFMITFSIAWGPTVWVCTSELSTGPNRGRLMSLSTGTNWFFSWMVTFTFPYLYDTDAGDMGASIGFLYGSLMVGACLWVFFLLPETAKRSLEQIDEMFIKGVPARQFSSYTFDHTLGEDKSGSSEPKHVEAVSVQEAT